MDFENMQVAKWKVGGLVLAFPAVTITETGGNRIVKRERPYRDGAKLDDTGSQAKSWEITVLFENSIQEAGLEVNTEPLYPGVLNSLVLSFDVHETGSLFLPTVGEVRARVGGYRRTETHDTRDAAQVSFTFIEDNEDAIDFRVVLPASANANARRLAEQTTFDLQSTGSWDQTMADLETALAETEDLLNSPFDTASEVQKRGERVRDLGKKAIQVFFNPGKRGRDQFTKSRGNRSERKILRERDMAGRSLAESQQGRPQVVSVVFALDLSIFSIAALLQQPFRDLITANPSLDPFFIPKETPVTVFATSGLNPGR